MPFFWNNIRDRSNDIPYAWYWKGKSLRTGHALGDRIRPIHVPSQSPTQNSCFHTHLALDWPEHVYSDIGNCNRSRLAPYTCKNLDKNDCKEYPRNRYHYRSSSGCYQASHCCCLRSGSHRTWLPRYSELVEQPISDPCTSGYYHPSDHHWDFISCPYAHDHQFANPARTTRPMSRGLRTTLSSYPPSMDDQIDAPLEHSRYIQSSPRLEKNELGMRQSSSTPGLHSYAYAGDCEPNTYGFYDCHISEMNEQGASIGELSAGDGSTEDEIRSYYRRRPRAR